MNGEVVRFKCFECGYSFVSDDEEDDGCPECGSSAYKQTDDQVMSILHTH